MQIVQTYRHRQTCIPDVNVSQTFIRPHACQPRQVCHLDSSDVSVVALKLSASAARPTGDSYAIACDGVLISVKFRIQSSPVSHHVWRKKQQSHMSWTILNHTALPVFDMQEVEATPFKTDSTVGSQLGSNQPCKSSARVPDSVSLRKLCSWSLWSM